MPVGKWVKGFGESPFNNTKRGNKRLLTFLYMQRSQLQEELLQKALDAGYKASVRETTLYPGGYGKMQAVQIVIEEID